MIYWTYEEENGFYKANIENFADMLKLIEDSSYYIERLKE